MLGILKRALGKRKDRREIQDFNVVVEGTWMGDWRNTHYKLARLEVPENAKTINDEDLTYSPFGREESEKSAEEDALETKVDSLAFCKGVVLPCKGGVFPNVLDRPRAIFLKDGRIFIEKEMAKDQEYLKTIQRSSQYARRLFDDPQTNEGYRKIMESYFP